MVKKEKDGPKRALSAYMFFVQEERPKIVKENPDLKFGEVGKQLGAKWKTMSDKEKEPYHKKAQADKARVEKEKGN